uniref:(northern house mosquito) hypothetical protein n=1 Tax=Culex pipiens TaxID=7175 RepID=A0A8D8IIR9_CULPI
MLILDSAQRSLEPASSEGSPHRPTLHPGIVAADGLFGSWGNLVYESSRKCATGMRKSNAESSALAESHSGFGHGTKSSTHTALFVFIPSVKTCGERTLGQKVRFQCR